MTFKQILAAATFVALSGCAELSKVVNTDALFEKPRAPIVVDYPKGEVTSAKSVDDVFAALNDKLLFQNPPATIKENPAAMHRQFGIESTPGVHYGIIQPFTIDADGVVYATYNLRETNLVSAHIRLSKQGAGTRIKYFFEGKSTRTSENIALFIERLIVQVSVQTTTLRETP